MNGIPSCTGSNRPELHTLISLSCHSACCVLSITEWVYHAIDSVSTIVVRQESVIDGSTDWPQYHWSGLQSRGFPNGPNYPLLPLLPMAMHWENEICLHCLPQKINLIRPSCRSIGTMGLRTSICPPFDIPNSFTITSLVQELLFGNNKSHFVFLPNENYT